MGKEAMRMTDAVKLAAETFAKDGPAGCIRLGSSYLNLVREPEVMSTGPLIIQIEPTLHCNLECSMCVNPLMKRQKRHLPLAGFQKIMAGIPSLRKISLVGAGEPLLNPDLFDMIAYAKSRSISIGFATNGMLLDERMCRRIIDSRAGWVNISVDSAQKERYETIRKGASFDRLLENTRRLVSAKGTRRVPEISIWFVIMKDNLADLPSVIRLAHSLGVNEVSAQMEHSWNESRIRDNMMKPDANDAQKTIGSILMEAAQTAFESRMRFNFVNVPDAGSGRACKWPWKSSYITAEGFVTPCCLQGSDPSTINFGNLFEEGFGDIWNNERYQAFRSRLKSDTPPDICRGCTSYFKSVRI